MNINGTDDRDCLNLCFDIDFDFQVAFIPKSIQLRIKESIITKIILMLHSLSHT